MTSTKRIEWIDYAKVAVMLLVILDHLGPRDRILSSWIWSLHLPAFFFISGLFASAKGAFVPFLKNNAYRLILPAVLWYLIGTIVWQPVMTYHLYPDTFWTEYGQLQIDFLLGRQIGMGWFMLALFWVRIVYYFVVRLPRWVQYIVAFILLPAIAVWAEGEPKAPFYIYHAFMAFPVYYLGMLCKDRVIAYQAKWWQTLPIVVALLLATIWLSPTETHSSFNALDFGQGVHITYLQAVLGSFFILSFAYTVHELIGSWRIISTLGEGTAVLLLFQAPFLLLAKVAYRKLFDCTIQGSYYDTASAFVASALIMLMMYPVILWINRHAPVLNGQRRQRI